METKVITGSHTGPRSLDVFGRVSSDRAWARNVVCRHWVMLHAHRALLNKPNYYYYYYNYYYYDYYYYYYYYYFVLFL
jgi:hypothetical protein